MTTEYTTRALRAQHRKNDEYYTTRSQVQAIFEKYLKNFDFFNKVIYCPADTEQSEFVKYLKENEYRFLYRSLIYTSDDFRLHQDLFNAADIIITNPPFSLILRALFPMLKKSGKKFFIYGSRITIGDYFRIWPELRILDPCEADRYIFNTPSGVKKIPVVFLTNISEKEALNCYPLFKINPENKLSEVYEIKVTNGARNYDRIDKIALSDDFLYLPVTVLLEHNRCLFEQLKIVDIDHHSSIFSDGKKRYCRILCKIKPEFLS